MFPPQNVQQGGSERKLAWGLYLFLVGCFATYAIFLFATAIHARVTGEGVGISVNIVEENFQLPNLWVCPQWFDFPNVTYVRSANSGFETCRSSCVETFPPGQVPVRLVDGRSMYGPIIKSDGFVPVYVQSTWDTIGDFCYLFDTSRNVATVNGMVFLALIFDAQFPSNDWHMETVAAVLELGGQYSSIFYLSLNQGYDVEITKSTRTNLGAKEQVTFDAEISPFAFKNIIDFMNGGSDYEEVLDEQFYNVHTSESKDITENENYDWSFIVLQTPKEETTIIHELDPLSFALVGQLGGAWSFVAIGFGFFFVRVHDYVNHLRANKLVARYANLPSKDTPPASGPPPSPTVSTPPSPNAQVVASQTKVAWSETRVGAEDLL